MMYKMFLVKVFYWLFGKIASFQHSSAPGNSPWPLSVQSSLVSILDILICELTKWLMKLSSLKTLESQILSVLHHMLLLLLKTADYWFQLEGGRQNLRQLNCSFTTISSQFFGIYIYIFQKTEVQTVILRCWTFLYLNWFYSYGIKG